MKQYFCYLTAFLLLCFSASAQKLQSPSEFLGYELGSHFTRHHQVVSYFNHVAQASNLVQYETYGKTNELRTLSIAYISSKANLDNLETIRKQHLSNAGIESTTPLTDKAVVWLSYNVHGNESSSTEAAMKTLYALVTEKKQWLENTIVIMDPCLNPDGRDRYVNWYNQVGRKSFDTNQHAREHHEPWPSGRPNHYLFDLNRDWAWATQVETRQRLKIYNKWLPHIHVDFHEQGINEPYYFAPAAEPYHEVITDWQRNFQIQIGKNNAHYFDKSGWLYFTRERFDLFYPSYGDTYPTFNGAIGMTYEQAGHGRAGLGIKTDEGDILTLKDRIAHHHTTGLSTVEMASNNATKINEEYKKYYNTNNFKYKSYVLRGDDDKKDKLKTLLDRHQIKYGYASGSTVSGFDFQKNGKGKMKTSTSDLVISTNQPKAKMIKVLFEPKSKLSDSITYDITAWSIPYAYGLKAIASEKYISTTTEKQSATTKPEANSNAYAYVFNWNHISDSKLLAALLQANIRVRFNEKYIENSGQQLQPGSLIVTRRDNKHLPDFDQKVAQIATQQNKPLASLATGFADKGSDIGSPDVKEIKNQKIAVLSGKYTSSLSFGEIQYFFEQEIKYPYTAIDVDDFSIDALNKYHILVLPNGYYYRLLNDNQLADLKSWIRRGGKIIAIGNACNAMAGKDGFGLSTKGNHDRSEVESHADKDTHFVSYNSMSRERMKNFISGAIFKTKLDNTHPLAFGYDSTYFTLKLSANTFNYLENGYNVARLEQSKVISGFAGSNTLKKLNNSLIFGEQPMGGGSVIYMVDNPLFRGFWENGKLFFANALFMTNVNLEEL